ncbi:hypothetical protein P9847_14745 [Paenibacillus chibensis]|uniref:Uncharacterized protein n=1 Tax=Paenibacillus chibensis TaxID=59846 RepID=A0ABU6PUL1_9BACL|nr:hypothetical protein [Paenibacillus chibensis]
MPVKKKRHKRKSAAKWVGQPVLVVLKDGSHYVGTVSSMDRSGVTLTALPQDGRFPESMLNDQAQVSGLLSSLLFGGFARAGRPGAARAAVGAGNARSGGGRGMFGFIGQMVPHIKIGMNVMRSIMPLMGLLK